MLFALIIGSPAHADEVASTQLIMVTSDHCPWCEAFEEEVGRFYHKTPEASVYPMLRVDIDDPFPAGFDDLNPAFFTPTFIFVRDGEEQGRIEGYPGQELFWWRMSEFLPQ
ncbi:MAG: thioredoxin family protein [Candidatus Puniceispirillales bacterium]